MESHWRVFTNTKTPEKAFKVIARLRSRMDRRPARILVKPYHKGGHIVTFDLPHEGQTWFDIIVDVLDCAQSIGGGWLLGSSIQTELNITCTDLLVPGVIMVDCNCARSEDPEWKWRLPDPPI